LATKTYSLSDTRLSHTQPEQCKSVSAFALRKTNEVRSILLKHSFRFTVRQR